MDLNKTLSKTGSAIVTVTVFLFALFLLIDFSMGSYFVCLILPIGFIMMTGGLQNECESDRKTAANIGLILAAVYGTFIMLVYYSQLTTVHNEQLNEQAAKLLKFNKFGLIFNYDLLGYGVMALSTFFTDVLRRRRTRRKASPCCVVCLFSSSWNSFLSSFQRKWQNPSSISCLKCKWKTPILLLQDIGVSCTVL